MTSARLRVHLALLLVFALAGCGPATAATWVAPTKPVAYPILPDVPFTYRTRTAPAGYEIVNTHALLTLRTTPLFRMSFLVDPAHPDAQSTLVATNKATGDKEHWTMAPVTVDGGAGYRAEYPVGSDTYLFYFFARGSVGVTLKASLGTNHDAAARRDAEQIIASFRFDTAPLKGTYPGHTPAPVIPFHYDIPADLAALTYPTELQSYQVNLLFGAQPVQVITETMDSAAAAAKAYRDRKARVQADGAHPGDLKTLPATADHLGRLIDEGYSLNLSTDGHVALVALSFRRGALLVTLMVTVNGPVTADTVTALQVPLDMAATWAFTG